MADGLILLASGFALGIVSLLGLTRLRRVRRDAHIQELERELERELQDTDRE